ncbi:hypothetical protein [uncultured Parabacteroides sp.]|jgi:hypothetical protein|uniref:hypothetical protein n=1 Tax=uncultured Parabacteroides sp. TaxID=512312 RepID=UPI0025D04876|nr:hypothetical protein [uncultured Parabacteroides sp.]
MEKQFTVIEIVENLVGKITPIGETNEDEIRFENLKVMCDLANSLISKIDDVAYQNEGSHEYSVKRAAEYAARFLTEQIGIQ